MGTSKSLWGKVRRASANLGAVAVMGGGLLATLGVAGPASAAEWPAEWKGVYRITFAGVSIGKFRMNMNTTASDYKIEGDTKLSIALGAIEWKGTVKANGAIANAALQPASHVMEFESNTQNGGTTITFEGGKVTKYDVKPEKKVSPYAIPLKPEEHLASVLDPLSAFVAAAVPVAGSDDPCNRTVPVFNGRQRFDLVFTPKKKDDAAGKITCKIKYVPVAGHKMNDETKAMAESEDIEAELMRAPEDGVVVPETITVPTSWGTVVLKALELTVVSKGGKSTVMIKGE